TAASTAVATAKTARILESPPPAGEMQTFEGSGPSPSPSLGGVRGFRVQCSAPQRQRAVLSLATGHKAVQLQFFTDGRAFHECLIASIDQARGRGRLGKVVGNCVARRDRSAERLGRDPERFPHHLVRSVTPLARNPPVNASQSSPRSNRTTVPNGISSWICGAFPLVFSRKRRVVW